MNAFLFPGQGSQHVGMGEDLFTAHPDLTEQADAILGKSITTLCLEDPDRLLDRTDNTQPALFTVCALTFLERMRQNPTPPRFAAGHSLGELAALFAAGAYDFETGIKLAQERGRLMAKARDGGMAAIIGLDADVLEAKLRSEGYSLELANKNTPIQTVISGNIDEIEQATPMLEAAKATVVPLRVSAAFHSNHMREASEAFAEHLKSVEFRELAFPVISNVTSRPYPMTGFPEAARQLLPAQLVSPVRWVETLNWLFDIGVDEFEEIGPGEVMTKLWTVNKDFADKKATKTLCAMTATDLGNADFLSDWGMDYAYIGGSMYHGISSESMVESMADKGMLCFFGTGGLGMDTLETRIETLSQTMGEKPNWGTNLLANPNKPDQEMLIAETLIRHNVPAIEASAFTHIQPSVVLFRFAGAKRGADGSVQDARRILAKLSRTEVAERFMQPAPTDVIDQLREDGLLTSEEAWCAARLPVAQDICMESDSGGHTDMASALTALPAMLSLRDHMRTETGFDLRVGAAGGLGSSKAIAAVFLMGADFVLTGSINQCTPEAGTSDAIKDILGSLGMEDTAYCPSGDMFELGAMTQVVSKGSFFPARARKLFELYRQHDSLEDIPAQTMKKLEKRFFRKPVNQVWAEVAKTLKERRPEMLERAERNGRVRMAQVFRWYFRETSRMALSGNMDDPTNLQIHCGPAMGSFNTMVRGTSMEDWRNRHVADIGFMLMEGAADTLNTCLNGNKLAEKA